jgi:2,3-bisphosphoglycerate-dependent phosphoglycerate mutase
VTSDAITQLLLVRHGLPRRERDPGLSEVGHAQAKALATWLHPENIDAIVSSPMPRARETAVPSADELGLAIRTLDDLREWDTDINAGADVYVPVEEFSDDDPRSIALAEGRFEDFVPELDTDAFIRRACAAVDQIIASVPRGSRVLVTCHGGVINTVLGRALGIPQVFWFNPGYTSVSRIESLPNGRIVVRSVNETAHLRDLD